MGFTGAEKSLFEQFGVQSVYDDYSTNNDHVFVAGDARRGPSLVSLGNPRRTQSRRENRPRSSCHGCTIKLRKLAVMASFLVGFKIVFRFVEKENIRLYSWA